MVLSVKRLPETVSAGLPLRMTRTALPGHGFCTVQSRPFSLMIFTLHTTPPLSSAETRNAPDGPQVAEAGVLVLGPAGEEADHAFVALQEHLVDRQETAATFDAAAAIVQQGFGKECLSHSSRSFARITCGS